ncbi:hypothetical protein PQ478_17905 [Alkalihalophilus pseudofirmus]|uniref:hypothetical protein n=1 Tax=Alkalihalophilus pseudofirmus TaxID=79885 RepID=UPI00259B8FDA|nr:hypothetical protein [Alkalihalophilus pseudofirmus]WEG16361.1 hypothetical protein PQ478_17905 [Alkalihalophilus pseudofirmus]
MERERYFVSVDMPVLSITKTETPDNLIQYEIYATPDEKDEIHALLESVSNQDFEPQQIFERPFQERKADNEKDHTQKEIRVLYEKLYALGSPETKEVLADIMPVGKTDSSQSSL